MTVLRFTLRHEPIFYSATKQLGAAQCEWLLALDSMAYPLGAETANSNQVSRGRDFLLLGMTRSTKKGKARGLPLSDRLSPAARGRAGFEPNA